MRNTNFPTDLYDYNNIDKGTGIKEGNTSAGIGSSRSKTNLISFFGRLNYNYNDKILLMPVYATKQLVSYTGQKILGELSLLFHWDGVFRKNRFCRG
jgi:hypothetical protein